MKNSEVVKKVYDYVENECNAEMKLDHIAKAVGYSKFHLNRLFKEETGTTIHQYILKRRMEQSKQLLLKTNQTVLEIALSSGYATQQSYTVAFRQVYHVTPQGYRIREIHSNQANRDIQARINVNRVTQMPSISKRKDGIERTVEFNLTNVINLRSCINITKEVMAA